MLFSAEQSRDAAAGRSTSPPSCPTGAWPRTLHVAIRGAMPRVNLRQVVAAATYPQLGWPAFDRPIYVALQPGTLLNEVSGTQHEDLLTVTLGSACRGEALGLHWSALDWETATLKRGPTAKPFS